MSGYDYGNVRLRAMKSRLLTRTEMENLAEADSLHALTATLSKTAYHKAIEAGLARTSGMAVIAEALRLDIKETLGKVRQFYMGTAAQCVSLLLQVYDVQNLKAVLRGLAQHLPADEIMDVILPVGELPESLWVELAAMDTPRDAIDLLATLRQPFAQPLLVLRAEKPGASPAEMELALEKWHFTQIRTDLQRAPRGAGCIDEAFRLEADVLNLLTMLRFAHAPAELSRLENNGLRDLLVGPGVLSFNILVEAGGQKTLKEAIVVLTSSPYNSALQSGLEAYETSGRLSDFERHLRLYRLHWMAEQITSDPLGMGVPLGYLALKTSEVNNLRWIAHGIRQALDSSIIKAGLELLK